MRTTLTLDDDVSVRLEELRRETGTPWRELVNSALRAGLDQLASGATRKRKPFRTRPMPVGKLLVPSLDDTSALLDLIDEERLKRDFGRFE
jgi:hypothetical protein